MKGTKMIEYARYHARESRGRGGTEGIQTARVSLRNYRYDSAALTLLQPSSSSRTLWHLTSSYRALARLRCWPRRLARMAQRA